MKKIYTYFGFYELNECQIADQDVQEALENDDLETVLGYLATTDQIQTIMLAEVTDDEELKNSGTWTYIDSTMSDYSFIGYVCIENLMVTEV